VAAHLEEDVERERGEQAQLRVGRDGPPATRAERLAPALALDVLELPRDSPAVVRGAAMRIAARQVESYERER
jgi:hypothetical protein